MNQALEKKVQRSVRELQSGIGVEANSQEVFEAFYPRIYRFLLRKGFAEPQAEDLAQDAMLQVFQKIEDFRQASTFTAWVFAIAANQARNARRYAFSLKRRGDELSLEDTEREGEPAGLVLQGTPEEMVSEKEQREVLKKAVTRLSPQRRQCVELQLRGFKMNEIATVLKLQSGTVKAHLFQAREQLRRDMEGMGGRTD